MAKQLRYRGIPAHAFRIDNEPAVWVEGKCDERKAWELLVEEQPPDCFENFIMAMETCAKLVGGCDNCNKKEECLEFFNDRVNRASHLTWPTKKEGDREVIGDAAQKVIREFNFWFHPLGKVMVK
jgi:hypothetical protein